jgi:teichuronic acid biosynthesis glycosyltransferase TuaC
MDVTAANARAPRVLVFTTLFPNPAQPGHGLFVYHRVRAAAADCPTRVVAPVLRRPGGWAGAAAIPLEERSDGMPVFHPPYFTVPALARCADGFLLYRQTLPAVRALRRELPFDLIDAHYAFPDGMAAALLARRFGVPLALTVRGGDLDLLTRFRARRRLIRWTLQRADRVFAVSRHMAERAVRFGARPDRVRVVENGVDLEQFSYLEQAGARRQLGIAAGQRLLLSVGHLIPEKGQHVLLEALAGLLANGSQTARLFLIGDDPAPRSGYRSRLERQIRALNLDARVELPGAKPQSELRAWYGAADALVLPTFREGCPNVVREALACGLPVVASRVGGVPELISSEALGLLVEPGDVPGLAAAIGSALERSWDRVAIARAGGRRSWTDAARQVVAELRALLTG